MKHSQSFGSNDINIYNPETDRITHLKSSYCNKYLFVGDSGGRMVVFKKNKQDNKYLWKPCFQYFGTKPNIDYLTNHKTDTKITGIIPLQYNDTCIHNIVSDTKNIYIYKLFNKKTPLKYIRFPFKITNRTETILKHELVNGHKFCLNSIALSNGMEYILSADDLTVNMWNINRPEKALPVINTEPVNLSTLTSTITKMKPDPHRENIIYTTSSNGIISTFDTRIRCFTDTPVKIMYSSKMISYDSADHLDRINVGIKNTREHLKYISDFDISMDLNHIVTRSPLYINIWDLRNTLQPCHSYPINKQIYSLIKDNYDISFEPFEINYSSDGMYIYSGSFDNVICINTKTNAINYTNERNLLDITVNSHRCTSVYSCNEDVFSCYNGILNIYTHKYI